MFVEDPCDRALAHQEELTLSWRTRVTDTLADLLRFAARAALLLSSIALSLAATYIILKVCWFTVRFLDRTIFNGPW